MNPLLMAVSNAQAGAYAAFTTASIIVWALLVILAIMLLIAPLRIWTWSKRACNAISELRETIRIAAMEAKRFDKEKKAQLAEIIVHLENIEAALCGGAEQSGQE